MEKINETERHLFEISKTDKSLQRQIMEQKLGIHKQNLEQERSSLILRIIRGK